MTASVMSLSPVVNRQHQGEVFEGADERFRCVLQADDTAGVFSMFELTIQPGGNAPMHRHLREDETMHILEGKLVAYTEDRRIEAGPGDTVFFPRGTPHAFCAQQPTRLLLVLHPGGTEQFYRAMCKLIRNRADLESFNLLSMEHNIEIIGPCPQD